MTKTKPRSMPSGVFLPGEDVAAYFNHHGDLGAVFDRVHAHFFDSFGRPRPSKRHQAHITKKN